MELRGLEVVIAEDDAVQAELLAGLVENLRPEWPISAITKTVAETRNALRRPGLKILILDVQLQRDNALNTLHVKEEETAIIVVTGTSAHAIRAFEKAVVDYVLKPVRLQRLSAALRKAEQYLQSSRLQPTAAGSPESTFDKWFVASQGKNAVVLQTSDVVYFQADLRYTRVIMRDGEALLRKGINYIEANLDSGRFVRIHRSVVLNLSHITRIQRDASGRMRVLLKDRDLELVVSRPYEHQFRPR